MTYNWNKKQYSFRQIRNINSRRGWAENNSRANSHLPFSQKIITMYFMAA